MTFREKLRISEEATHSLLCLGLDPEPDLMPVSSWMFDQVPTVDASAWRLRVSGPGGVREWTYEELAAFEEACRETYDRMARISIVPDWARYFDFGAGRFPGFLRGLTSKD